MRFKADENISRQLAQLLLDHGHDVQTVAEEGLAGARDPHIAAAAASEERMILTTDRGFADVRVYPPGTHAGIVVLRARELRHSMLLMLLRSFLLQYDLDGFIGCNVVVEPGSVRVRRPQN